MKRYPVDEEDDELEEQTQRSVVRPRSLSPADAARQLQAELTRYGHGSHLVGSSDLVLVQQTAQQEVDLRVQRERIEDLETQRRWLWGGLGASAAVLLLLAFRKRRPPATSTPYPGQLAGKRPAA